jgi:hypothetical protein
MYTIEEVTKPLIGGISEIEFVPVNGVDSFPEIIDSGISKMDIILKSGYSWTDIPILDDSGTYEELEADSANGTTYAKRLSAYLPHDSQVNRNTLKGLRYLDLLVKYKDRNGNAMLLGTIDEPLQVKTSFAVNQLGSQKGYSFQFIGQHTISALFLTLPDLPQFAINELGQLIYQGGLAEDFAIDSDGKITVTGDQEARYSLDSRGRIVFV